MKCFILLCFFAFVRVMLLLKYLGLELFGKAESRDPRNMTLPYALYLNVIWVRPMCCSPPLEKNQPWSRAGVSSAGWTLYHLITHRELWGVALCTVQFCLRALTQLLLIVVVKRPSRPQPWTTAFQKKRSVFSLLVNYDFILKCLNNENPRIIETCKQGKR